MEAERRAKDDNVGPFLVATSFALNVALAAILLSFDTPNGKFDYWFERYQAVLVGVPTIGIALFTAIKLVEQIRKFSEQNNIAADALALARAEMLAHQKSKLSELARATRALAGVLSNIATTIRTSSIGEVRAGFKRTLDSRIDDFREVALAILETDNERELFNTANCKLVRIFRIEEFKWASVDEVIDNVEGAQHAIRAFQGACMKRFKVVFP